MKNETEAGETPSAGAERESGLNPALEPATARRNTGPHIIASTLPTLSRGPGVYRMLDTNGEVLYVGKARNLRARVSSYARLTGHPNRIARMIAATAAMEFVTVRTEAEALLLEANLIKRFRPPYNVVMRDDKSFPYILLARDHEAPQLVKHRGARTRKGDYFGPFASAGAVNRTLDTLQRAFLLRTCTDSVYASRTRPCLLYQIKRCSAPCTGEIPLGEYARLVDEAGAFLRGRSQSVRELYQRLMREASHRLEFERAAAYRDRLTALAQVTAGQAINPQGIVEADVFAIHRESGQTCVEVFFFRSGQNWGNRAYFPKADAALPSGEVLESFAAQFYDDKPIPRLILVSEDLPEAKLLSEALGAKAGHRVEVHAPKRGVKAEIVAAARANAREALLRRLAEHASQHTLLVALAARFGLKAPPKRIEVYDNSHISGTNAVGAMIVAGPEGFVKKAYRKFNIRDVNIAPGDDYAMMREVLTRRFRRLAASAAPRFRGEGKGEGPEQAREEVDESQEVSAEDLGAFPERPDLVLIDGGAGQLAIAREVLTELGVKGIALIGVAKGPERNAGREHFHLPGRAAPLILETNDPVLYFVQRLRDEAHRFVIGSHRARRAKALSTNPLDGIEGIGPKRRRALLRHFGSAKAVSRAGIADLEAVEGISAELARKIHAYFHEQSMADGAVSAR